MFTGSGIGYEKEIKRFENKDGELVTIRSVASIRLSSSRGCVDINSTSYIGPFTDDRFSYSTNKYRGWFNDSKE